MIVLIVDDNQLNRFTLRSMLEEMLTEESAILEACDGKEMIAVCKEKMPDVVFADIKMPYVNGIDAIAECKKYNLDSVFVVVSGYSDFEVAQRALQLGVQDYLLKPVDEEKLRIVMDKIQTKLGEEKEVQNSRFKLELFHAFNDFRMLGNEQGYEEKNYGEDVSYEVISVKIRYRVNNQKSNVSLQSEIIQRMELLGKRLLKSRSYYSHIYSEEGNVFFVFCTTKEGRGEIHSFVRQMAQQMKKPDIALHFTCFSRKSMREVYDECKQADICKGIEMNYPAGELIDLDQNTISEEAKQVLKLMSRLMDAWECGDAAAYKEIAYRLHDGGYSEKNLDVNIEALNQYCALMGLNLSGESCESFCRSLIESVPLVFTDTKGETDVIDLVKAYIERNYMKDIGVAQVAEMFDITPNYLSSIFRQKAGLKFTEYLTEVRVEHAKQLLIQNRTAPINDIAVMAGYNRAGYFTMVFQKITGLTPSDYRKKHLA